MDEELKNSVWKKAKKVDGYDPDVIRQDVCGAWIIFEEYRNVNSDYGWEIDHIYPKSRGGEDDEINMRPMNWRNNKSKGDDYPVYRAAVSADGNNNIEVPNYMRINENVQKELKTLYNINGGELE